MGTCHHYHEQGFHDISVSAPGLHHHHFQQYDVASLQFCRKEGNQGLGSKCGGYTNSTRRMICAVPVHVSIGIAQRADTCLRVITVVIMIVRSGCCY